jgi:BNR repeat-like domain
MRPFKYLYNNLATIALFSLLLFTSLVPWRSSSAQSQNADQTWTTPINLSHSGSTTNPSIVVDSNGIVHVVWVDKIAGEMYTSFDGTQWSAPAPVSLPFGAVPSNGSAQPTSITNIRLIADSKGYVHAFWVDQNNQLHYSRVSGSLMANGANWDPQQILANSAVDYDVALDNQDRIHLAYVRAIDEGGFPAGMYYRQLAANGASWGNPVVLYKSQYFRSLTSQIANVSIATDENGSGENIYVAWDNRPRKQVFFSRTTDGGELWSDPVEIDKPNTKNGFATPLNIRVATNNQGTLIEWQVGDNSGNCTQTYQWSTDNGSTWDDRRFMLASLRGCAVENQYFESGNNLFLATTIDAQIYFLAWNGESWSDPLPQTELFGFQDPETYAQVIFDCRSITQGPKDSIYVVGCDTGNGADIWLTSRSLGDISTWFPSTTDWSRPVELTSGANDINFIKLLADKMGNFHAFWVQPYISASITSTVGTIKPPQVIYYSQLQGEKWQQPMTISDPSTGNVGQLSVTTDDTGDLLLVWTEADTGDIMFTWANAGVANIASEWSKPVALPSLRSENISPFILAGGSGRIFVAYAIPLNEDRGIYLTQSNDNGASWSQPVQIFNGVTAGSQVVDQPKLAITSDGVIHVLWNQSSVIGDNNSPRLFYSRSLDGGKTWADPVVVVNGSTNWDQILGFGDLAQRIWQAKENDQSILWLQTSTDSGLNWSQPASFSNFGGNLTLPDLIGDNIQQPNIFFIANDLSGGQVLKHLRWDGKGWSAQEDFRFNNATENVVSSVAAAITSNGQLGVLFDLKSGDGTINQPVISLNFAQREVLEANPTSTTPSPTIVPVPTSTISSTTETLVIPPTPTPIVLPNNLENIVPQSGFLNNSWAGTILGTALAVLLVGSAFVVVFQLTKSNRH